MSDQPPSMSGITCSVRALAHSNRRIPVSGHLSARRVGELVAEALPGRWTAHTLRHRYATLAYQRTGDLRAVQELLGHAKPETTARYTLVAPPTLRAVASTVWGSAA